MKISCRWLARHVDLSGLTAGELANDLTIHTAEVEGVEPFAPWLGQVVVGHLGRRQPGQVDVAREPAERDLHRV